MQIDFFLMLDQEKDLGFNSGQVASSTTRNAMRDGSRGIDGVVPATLQAGKQPFANSAFDPFGRGGCIGRSKFDQPLRCTLLRISDLIRRKVQPIAEGAEVLPPKLRGRISSCVRLVQPFLKEFVK